MDQKTIKIPIEKIVEYTDTLERVEEIVSSSGFSPMKTSNQTILPAGTMVILYNHISHMIIPATIVQWTSTGIYFYNHLNRIVHSAMVEHLSEEDQKNFSYIIIGKIPCTNCYPILNKLDQSLKKAGFQSMKKVVPDELPEGAVALLYNKRAFTITPVIIIQLYGRKFLQAGNLVNIFSLDFENAIVVIDVFENYEFFVIS